jgi:hypothetical protein
LVGFRAAISRKRAANRFDRQPLTSGLPRSTDILDVRGHVSNLPIADMIKKGR